MKTPIRKLGNSQGVIIPKSMLAQARLQDEAEMVVEKGVIVAPMAASGESALFRPAMRLGGKRRLILLDQIFTLDKARLVRRVGTLGPATLRSALTALQQTFAP